MFSHIQTFRALEQSMVRKLAFCILVIACIGAGPAAAVAPTASETARRCTQEMAPQLRSQNTMRDALWDAANLCATLMADEHRDQEQGIRADNYVFQRTENLVLMWMVVAITIAGVFLAGAQLWASYVLAKAGRRAAVGLPAAAATISDTGSADSGFPLAATTIHFSKDELAVQSSVVGVIVLAISFAFFLVFVLYVYTFQEPAQTSTAASSTAAEGAAPHQTSSGTLQSLPPGH